MNASLKLSSKEDVRTGFSRGRHEVIQVADAPCIDTSDIEALLSARGYGEKKNLALFAIKHTARRSLPYGIWYCVGGREVIFNRDYQPIAQRVDGVVSYADRDEFVDAIEREVKFYDDLHNPVAYLVKHLGSIPQSGTDSNKSKKALLRCLKVLRDFTPPEHGSVSSQWSLL